GNRLQDLHRRTGVWLLCITHNLGIVAKMCDRVAVMYAGRIVEQGSTRQLFTAPQHPYTEALLSSIPKIGSREPLRGIPGSPPNLASLPPGCAFQPRCTRAIDRCSEEAPGETNLGHQHVSRCWLAEQSTTPLPVGELR